MYGAILADIIGSPYEFDIGNKSKVFLCFPGIPPIRTPRSPNQPPHCTRNRKLILILHKTERF